MKYDTMVRFINSFVVHISSEWIRIQVRYHDHLESKQFINHIVHK